MSLHRLAIAAAICLAVWVPPAGAGAGAAGGEFCGGAGGAPAALQERIKATAGIKEIHRDKEYVAYQDAATSAVFTFTEPAHAAHPAAVCRKPVQKGETLEIEMAIVCAGAEKHCKTLETDFKLLNAKMQADIDNQIAAGKR